jgi:hypothetical protein
MALSVSNASVFFEKIIGLGNDAFKFLFDIAQKSAQTEENEWREFKAGGFIGMVPKAGASGKKVFNPDQKVKAIWSESLGAFANSGGGVLIWGIKAPNKVAEGVDLVADARGLEVRLKDLASDALDPPVLGVEVLAVTGRPDSIGSGFVVCYIPVSDHSPHRSVWGDHEYCLRTQDGNRPIPTAVLRRMFYPQASPVLFPIAKAEIVRGDDGWYHFQMSVDLKNRGLASGEDVAIQLSSNRGFRPHHDVHNWTTDGSIFRSTSTIHPEQTVRWLHNCTNDVRNWQEEGLIISFNIRIFARNAPANAFELNFTGAELVKMIGFQGPIEREAKLVGA